MIAAVFPSLRSGSGRSCHNDGEPSELGVDRAVQHGLARCQEVGRMQSRLRVTRDMAVTFHRMGCLREASLES